MWRAKLVIFLFVNLLGARTLSFDVDKSVQESWLTTKVISLISTEIEKRTGLNTRVRNGSVQFINRTITLHQVELGDGLISVPEVNIKLALMDFFNGGIGIESISLESPIVNLSKKTRSKIRWTTQAPATRFFMIPKIIIKSGTANVLDQSLLLGKGLYRFEALLFQGKDGYINFTGESRFTFKKKKIVEPASISLVGELSPNNYLTTRISFTTPVMSGNGDGQIQLDTGETRYSLYSSSNIFSKSDTFLSFMKGSNIDSSKTTIKVNRDSKDSDWRFFISSDIKSISIYHPIKAQLVAHIPNNINLKVLKLDYAQIAINQGLMKLIKRSEGEFSIQIKQYSMELFNQALLIKDLNNTNVNAVGRIRINNLLAINEVNSLSLTGDFSRKDKNLGRFDFDFVNGKMILNNLFFNSHDFSFRTIPSNSSSMDRTLFICESNLESLSVYTPFFNDGTRTLKGRIEAKGSLLLDKGSSSIHADFIVKDLNFNLLRVNTLLGKLSLTPNNIYLEALESQGETQFSGSLNYPIGASKEDIKGRITFIQSDYRQLMSLWGLSSILDSNLTGRLDISGQPSRIYISSSIILDNPRWLDYSLPPLSFNLTYDQNQKSLGITEFKTITSNLSTSTPTTESSGLKGQAIFNFRENTSSIKLNGDLKSTLQTRGDVVSGFIDVDLEGDLKRPFGYGYFPLGQIKITPYPDSKRKLSFLYIFDGDELTINLDDVELERRLIELNAIGNQALSKGTFSLKQLDNKYLNYFLTDTYFDRLLGSSVFEVEGRYVSSPSTFNYSVNVLNLGGILDHYGLDKKKAFNLEGNQDQVTVNLSFANLSEETTTQSSFFTLKGLLPLTSSGQFDLEITGQSTIKDLSSILTRIATDKGPLGRNEYELGGRSLYRIKAKGAIDVPILLGEIEVQDGSIIFEKVRLLEGFKGKFNLIDQRIHIDSKNPMDGSLLGSPIKIFGSADWNLRTIGNISLSAEAQNIRIQSLPGWEGLRIRGDVSLDFNSSPSSKLSGQLIIHEFSYLDEKQLYEVISFGGENKGSAALKGDSLLNNIELDIDVDSNNVWRYNSEFIKAELKPRGRIKAIGTLLQPSFQGELLLVPGGRLSNVFPAGDLVLERGVIQIIEDFRDPQLDLQGFLLLPGYKLNLGLIGKLSDLKIQAASTPALKRDEIFALLMDPDYATRLYSSTVSYTGGTGYQVLTNQAYSTSGSSLFTSLILSNLQTRLRKSLGLDRVLINIHTGPSGRLESSYQVGINVWDTAYPLILSQNQIGDLRINSAKFQWNFPFGLANLGLSQAAGYSIYPSGEVRFNWSSRK